MSLKAVSANDRRKTRAPMTIAANIQATDASQRLDLLRNRTLPRDHSRCVGAHGPGYCSNLDAKFAEDPGKDTLVSSLALNIYLFNNVPRCRHVCGDPIN